MKPAVAWRPVCSIDHLPHDRGVAALVDGTQVALFRLLGADRIYALGNVDPFSGVGCLSRGIVGDVAGEPMVASPLHKQRFSLQTGRCLDDPDAGVETFDVRVAGEIVEVHLP
jgi:nitrite reductase (NADH) small subunit